MALQGILQKNVSAYICGEDAAKIKEAGSWGYETGCLLLGCKKMYEATKDQAYKDYIIQVMESLVDGEDNLTTDLQEKKDLEFAVAGNLLYFMYDHTGEARYQKAIDAMVERLGNQPRLASGNYCQNADEPGKLGLEGLYMALPFCLEYENRFNDRKNYYEIKNQFGSARDYMYDEVAGLYRSSYDEEIGVAGGFEPEVMGLHLMAMADCFDLTSEELYDCKRAIADWYREAIKGMIPWQKDNQDVKTSLMMAYSMLKACRLELLLADKYQKTGEAILETAVAGDVDGPVAYGALMLAYGEYLLLHDGEN